MKKSLFLLPLLAGLALCGCNDDKDKGNNDDGGNKGPELGELIGKIEMKNPSGKAKDVTDTSCYFESGDCKVTIDKYNNEKDLVSTAVSASGKNEFRLYYGMKAVLSCSKEFSAFKVVTTTYSDSKYVYDSPNFENATAYFDGTCTTTVVLEESAKSFDSVYAYKQIRIDSIEFYK